MKARDVIIYADDTAIAACVSLDITTKCETIETTSPVSGDSKHYIPGRKSWTASAKQLAIAVRDVLAVGRTVRLAIGKLEDGELSTDNVSGQAIITQCNISAGLGLVSGSVNFQGTGPLS